MPTYQIDGPDGKTYEIDGPPGASQQQVIAAVQAQLAAQKPKVAILEDIKQTIPAAAQRAAIGPAGLPGDLASLLNKGIDYVTGQPAAGKYDLGTSKQLTDLYEKNVSGPLYESQTPEGRAIGTGIELASNLLGGGGAARLGARALSGVVAPTLAIEATRGTGYEMLAAIGASLAAGKFMQPRVPTSALSSRGIKEAATDTYTAEREANIARPISQSALEDVQGAALARMAKHGPDRELAPGAWGVVDRLTNGAGRQAPTTETKTIVRGPGFHIADEIVTPNADVADLVTTRQKLKDFFKNPKPDENKAAAAQALPIIEAKIQQLSPDTMRRLRDADRNYSIARSAEVLDKRFYNADLMAAGEGSGRNLGNKTLQQITGFLKSPESRYIPADVRRALEAVVRGGFVRDKIRLAANALGGGGGLGLGISAGLGAGAAYGTGTPEFGLAPLAGLGLRGLFNRQVARQAAAASEKLRASAPASRMMPPPVALGDDSLIRALSAGILGGL